MISRRSIITGLSALIVSPALVRASSLMQVRGIIMPVPDLTLTLGEPAEFSKYAPGNWISAFAMDMQAEGIIPVPVFPAQLIDGALYRVLCVYGDGRVELCGPFPFPSPAGREG